MQRLSRTTLALLLTCCATAAAPAQVVLDMFNRPDSTNLGPDWTEQAGDTSILGNAARGTDTSLMTFVGQTGMAVSVDVFLNGANLQYGALVLGYADLANNLFVKVQSDSDSITYNTVWFYYGNNGSSFGTGSTFFPLTPFNSARMTLSLVGTTATLTLDTNFDGIADQVFSRSDVPVGSLGTGIGLGFFGATSMDNFTLAAVPEPSTAWLMLLGAGVGTGWFRIRERRRS